MSELPHTTKEKQEGLEFSIPRGSVPCIPKSTSIAVPPAPAIWKQFLRRTASSNLLMSIACLIVTHLAVPFAHVVYAMIVGGLITVSLQTSADHNFTPLHIYYIDTATGN